MYSSVYCKCVRIYYCLCSVAIRLREADVNLEYGIWGNKNLCICFVVTCSSTTYYLILTEVRDVFYINKYCWKHDRESNGEIKWFLHTGLVTQFFESLWLKVQLKDTRKHFVPSTCVRLLFTYWFNSLALVIIWLCDWEWKKFRYIKTEEKRWHIQWYKANKIDSKIDKPWIWV